MKNWHTEKLIVNDTDVDFSQKVPVNELMRFVQLATFEHSKEMELDHETMLSRSNAFWVITKMKLLLNGEIKSGDKINITTWTHETGSVRALRDCVIKQKNSVKVKATAEWCCLDYETRKIRKLNSINYPQLQMEKTKNLNTKFSNIKEEVDSKDLVYKKTIRSSDVDLNNHTNNMKYNNIVIDAFTTDELSKIVLKEYEIYFVNESYEGDVIDVYKKKIKNIYYVEGKIQEKTIFRAVIKYKKKER